MFTRLYESLWSLLYMLVSIYEKLRWLDRRLQAATQWSHDLICGGRKYSERRDSVFLENCKKQLTKLPKHLNIVVGPSDTEMNNEVFARILRYALIMDIHCVSLYDMRLAQSKSVILEKLVTPEGYHSKPLNKHHLQWTTAVATILNGKKDGIRNGDIQKGALNGSGAPHEMTHSSRDKTFQIIEITQNDGRPLIADVCRQFFLERTSENIQNLLKDRSQLTERINDELTQRLYNISDPELSIVYNIHTCTFGVLPWQTRFTEFHTHETGQYFDAKAFAKVLYRYSRCEQRWGK